MSKFIRLIIAAAIGLFITVGLLALMQILIHSDDVELDKTENRKIADVQMGDTEIEANVAERKPDKPEELEEEPPELEQPDLQDLDVSPDAISITPSLNSELNVGGPGLSASDGEYLPMVKVQPQYPRRALSRGIEGYCTVQYTVTKTGAVRDAKAIDCAPKGIFDSVSVKAAAKFKYKPRIENGEAIEVSGVKNKFTYKLAK